MDSPSSSISSLSASEATRMLKDLLNVGKQNLVPSSDPLEFKAGVSEDSVASAKSSSTNGDHHHVTESGDALLSSASNTSSLLQDNLSQGGQGMIRQQILLQGDDEKNSFNIFGRDIDIILSDIKNPTAASNKVKTNTVVKYDWENDYYYGHLVAVHRDGVYMAYTLLKGKSGGMVKLINCKTADRSLVKGFQGKVLDVSFAHLSAVIFGAVDQTGNLFVYEIQEDNKGEIEPVLLLQVNRPEGTVESEFHRLIWCPYIPEEDESSGSNISSMPEDAGKLLVLTHGEVAEMWNVDIVTNSYGNGPLLPEEVEQGYLKISSHTKPIVDASFSPDGTAIATASLDGFVKFFQVYMQDQNPPKCLHEWKPHDGKPVSSLFFLDDHKQPNPDVQFWKYAITGADNNQELKVWSCETWSCLQTIRFTFPSSQQFQPSIKASIDLSSNYLLLSDIHRKVLYIMNIYQEADAGKANFTTISEFLLTQPCLSLAIVNAGRHRISKGMADSADIGGMTTGEIDNDDEEEVPREANGPDIGVRVKVYSVHTRALQELRIRYQEEASLSRLPPLSYASSTTDGLRDGLSDVTLDTTGASEADRILAAASASGEASGSESSSRSHSKSKDLMDDFRGCEKSASSTAGSNHSGASDGRSRRDDPLMNSALSADPSELSYHSSNHDDQPLLQTPDDFASPRSEASHATRPLVEQGSVHSSASSSFTQVSAMDVDSRTTPHGSVTATTLISPGSSVTVTPTSSRDLSGASASLDTPTSLPLPPVTPNEEKALAMPKFNHEDIQDTPERRGFPNAPNLSSSPDTKSGMPAPPRQTLEGSGRSPRNRNDAGDDVYSASRRVPLQSTGSSSSASLEISEILEGKKPESAQYEETDDEAGSVKEKDQVIDQLIEEREEDSPSVYGSGGKWPLAPAVEQVNKEAQRLASQAIQRAEEMQMQMKQQEDLEEEEEGVEQEDDDVQIEDEKEELDNPQGVAPVATSSQLRDQTALFYHDLSAFKELQSSITQMVGLLRNQQQEISDLREELYNQRQTTNVIQGLQVQLDSLETILENKVTGALNEHSHRTETDLLHKVLQERESQERIKQDRLLHTVSQTMDKTLANRLEKTVREEIRQTVMPNIAGMFEPVKAQIHIDVAQKLTATDAVLKDSISKLVRSRQTVEAIGQVAGQSIQGHLTTICREVIVPGFDRTCQRVFHQVNETFQKGTQEYVNHLENNLEQVKRRHEEGRDPVVAQLTGVMESLRQRGDAVDSTVNHLRGLTGKVQEQLDQVSALHTRQATFERQLTQTLTGMEDRILLEARKMMQEELNSALQEQQANLNDSINVALRSGAVTPLPPMTPDPQRQQAEILSTLRKGQVNLAFQQALSAADLNLLMYVCETVDPTDIFNQTPCPLQQNVLLSLIQQLSAELSSNTATKHRYLQEALMNLDSKHPMVREHGPSVLNHLCQKLRLFIQAHPEDKMVRPFRMLLMASQSALQV